MKRTMIFAALAALVAASASATWPIGMGAFKNIERKTNMFATCAWDWHTTYLDTGNYVDDDFLKLIDAGQIPITRYDRDGTIYLQASIALNGPRYKNRQMQGFARAMLWTVYRTMPIERDGAKAGVLRVVAFLTARTVDHDPGEWIQINNEWCKINTVSLYYNYYRNIP